MTRKIASTRVAGRPDAERMAPAARMTGRAVTALVGGYAATAAIAALSARALPGSRVEASAWAMTFSFLLFAALGLWAFHERRLWLVASVIWGSGILAAAMLLAIGARP